MLALNNCSNVIANLNQINDSTATSPITNNYLGTITARRSSNLALGGNTWINEIASTYDTGVFYDSLTTSTVSAATNALVNFVGTTASEPFESYAVGTTFSSGQTMGAAGGNWASGWRTGGSYAIPRGTVNSTSPVSSGNYLAGTITTQAGHSAASGAIIRAFDASGISTPFKIYFSLRPDTTPANVTYLLGDNQLRSAFGPDVTSAWQIGSVNGTWQFLNGSANGGPNAYVDTGMPVVSGVVYDFVVTVDPVAHTWRATIVNGNSYASRAGLNARSNTFAIDTTDAVGGRWLTFALKENVTGSSVGATGNFSVDSLVVEH